MPCLRHAELHDSGHSMLVLLLAALLVLLNIPSKAGGGGNKYGMPEAAAVKGAAPAAPATPAQGFGAVPPQDQQQPRVQPEQPSQGNLFGKQ